MAEHNDFGQIGEQMAAAYLEEQGYTILERNCRLHHWEVDIIALKDGEVVFVEVKTRSSEQYGRAEEAVDLRKAQRMRVVADRYMRANHRQESARLDVIAIVREAEGYTLRHLKGAFNVFSLGVARGIGSYSRSKGRSIFK